METQANAEYIAAASPDVILDLIARLEKLEKENALYVETCKYTTTSMEMTSRILEEISDELDKRTESQTDKEAIRSSLYKQCHEALVKVERLEAEADWLAEKIVNDFAWTPHYCKPTNCLSCEYGGECKNYWREAARNAVEIQNVNTKNSES